MAVEAPRSWPDLAPKTRAGSSTLPDAPSFGRVRRAQWGRRLLLVFLAAIVVVGLIGLLGTRSRTTESSGNGYDLKVHYASIARPGVAVPFDIQVEHDGGFAGPVSVAVSSSYLASVDAQAPEPQPESATSDGDLIIFQFDPPAGDEFDVAWEAEVDPTANMGRKEAMVAVIDDAGNPAVSVSLRTWVLP